jgi:molybdate transport system ATP-binding protein
MSTLSLNVALDRPGFELRVDLDLALSGITVFGPSGSGKTTLLRVVAGLEREARGSVSFDGDVWLRADVHVPAHQRRIGYVFQDGRLFPHLTVEQNLRFALQRGSNGSQRPPIDFSAAVSALDLRPLLARSTPSLSGGEQQRVAIARALLTSPRLMLMDEPLSSLDVARKREILPHIERLPETFGVPVLYVTHNVDEVARLASGVVLLAAGRVVAHGGVGEIFERADLSDLTGGLEAGVVLRARVTAHDRGIATLALGRQQLRVPMAAAEIGALHPFRIHARDVAIATARPEKLSIRNVLVARVVSIETGANPNVEIMLDVDGKHLRARITRDALEELDLAPGREVYALIKSVALEGSLGS